jgi:hypothetical protein
MPFMVDERVMLFSLKERSKSDERATAENPWWPLSGCDWISRLDFHHLLALGAMANIQQCRRRQPCWPGWAA